MQGEQNRVTVEAHECDRVDVQCVNSDSGLELLLRFYPVHGIRSIAFVIPAEDAEELALTVLQHVKSIDQPENLN